MKYSYITDSKLRNIMILANRKRKFSGISIKISKSKNKIKKIPISSSEKRKKYQSKVYALQTYMEESKKRSKIKAEGKMGALRGYGQKDPLIEYKNEGYDMFLEMMTNMRRNVIYSMFMFEPKSEKGT